MSKRRSKRLRKIPPELKECNSLGNSGKRWTTEIDETLLRLKNNENKSWKEISNELQRTPFSVQTHYEKLTCKKRKKHKKNKNKLECDESDSESTGSSIFSFISNRIQCPFCKENFINVYTKNTHIKKVHRMNPWTCNQCNERFAKKRDLKSHQIKSHSNTNNDTSSINVNDIIQEICNERNIEQITSNTNTIANNIEHTSLNDNDMSDLDDHLTHDTSNDNGIGINYNNNEMDRININDQISEILTEPILPNVNNNNCKTEDTSTLMFNNNNNTETMYTNMSATDYSISSVNRLDNNDNMSFCSTNNLPPLECNKRQIIGNNNIRKDIIVLSDDNDNDNISTGPPVKRRKLQIWTVGNIRNTNDVMEWLKSIGMVKYDKAEIRQKFEGAEMDGDGLKAIGDDDNDWWKHLDRFEIKNFADQMKIRKAIKKL